MHHKPLTMRPSTFKIFGEGRPKCGLHWRYIPGIRCQKSAISYARQRWQERAHDNERRPVRLRSAAGFTTRNPRRFQALKSRAASLMHHKPLMIDEFTTQQIRHGESVLWRTRRHTI